MRRKANSDVESSLTKNESSEEGSYLNGQEHEKNRDHDRNEEWEFYAHPNHGDDQKNPSLCVAVSAPVKTQIQFIYISAESEIGILFCILCEAMTSVVV